MKKRNNYQKNQKNAVRESLTRELNRRRNNDVDIKEVAPAVGRSRYPKYEVIVV